MSDLSQEEIDKLLASAAAEPPKQGFRFLTAQEADAIGEIGNISLGSASTTLSMLLGNKVEITAPRVKEFDEIEKVFNLEKDCLTVEITYTKGLEGVTIFVLDTNDSAVIADLMMGGDGKPKKIEVTELQMSAVGEAMNQMIGTSSTTLSSIFNKAIDISPPVIKHFEVNKEKVTFSKEIHQVPVIAVCFDLKIGDLIDSEIIQVMSLESVKSQIQMLQSSMNDVAEDVKTSTSSPAAAPQPQQAQPQPQPQPAQKSEPAPPPVTVQPVQFASFDNNQSISGEENKNLNLVMDVKLDLSVELGRTELPIKKILELTRGSVIELDKIAGEPVDLYANGKIIAKGEVVVIEDSFGLRITNIISPQNRINNI